MKEITIEELAYLLKQAKDTNQPQPIFFLGAGASKTGNIPLAGEIVDKILNDYSDSPFIKKLPIESRTYSKLMECLSPHQRHVLLKKYIDEAKINVTHIYLAQLLKKGFVDYILTVNFDNLMLRALALYNEFPSTYDMAILKDLTTTTFKVKSVVYLHGQHHGLWLLNTSEEMEKVKATVPRIFDSIKNNRPWIFIGYSGGDPIFEHVKSLGRFDNGIYWVTHNYYNPNERVEEFLNTPNTNAFLVRGYDSDSFMLKLNSELGIGQPYVVDKPFTALKEMLSEMVDIDDYEHFRGVKERLEISRRQVNEAIQQFEVGKLDANADFKETSEIDLLKKELINLIIKDDFEEAHLLNLDERVKLVKDNNVKVLLSAVYSNWGVMLVSQAKAKEGKEADPLYWQAFGKYQKAIEIEPNQHDAYNNWGNALGHQAKNKEGNEAEELYKQAFEKYQRAIEIKPDKYRAYGNWGIELCNLAWIKGGIEAEELFKQAFTKFEKAIEINPNQFEFYNTWGGALGWLARAKNGTEAEELFKQSYEKFQKLIEKKPNNHEAYFNWGKTLSDQADTKSGKEAEELYKQAIVKYEKSIEIEPDQSNSYNNLGICLVVLAKNRRGKDAEVLYKRAFEKFQKAIEMLPKKQRVYNNWGHGLGSFAMIKEGKEAEELYKQAFEKFQSSLEIDPNQYKVYESWAEHLVCLAKAKEGREAEELYKEAIEKAQRAFEIGGECYNLACALALIGSKNEALFYLDISLKNKEVQVSFVRDDDDWKSLEGDKDFNDLLDKYRKLS